MSDRPPVHRVPGYNVDRVNIKAGLELAARFGYDSARDHMVVEYALQRHARGEEDGCQRSMLSHGIDLISYYAILAAALAAGATREGATPVTEDQPTTEPEPAVDGLRIQIAFGRMPYAADAIRPILNARRHGEPMTESVIVEALERLATSLHEHGETCAAQRVELEQLRADRAALRRLLGTAP